MQGRRRLADLETQAAQPSEYDAKLAELMQRQQELVAALDLTKGQAVASAEAEGEPVTQPSREEPDAGSAREGDWGW